jgi:hypothetical protein
LHHAFKSAPVQGGTMDLIEDLTVGKDFAPYWCGRRAGVA